MALQLGLDVSHSGDVTMVLVQGELDAASAPDLSRFLQLVADAGITELAIDMGDLSFIDSHGLDTIVRWRDNFGERGGDLLLYRPNRLVIRMLEAMGVRERLRAVAAPVPVAEVTAS